MNNRSHLEFRLSFVRSLQVGVFSSTYMKMAIVQFLTFLRKLKPSRTIYLTRRLSIRTKLNLTWDRRVSTTRKLSVVETQPS
ncbi:hypothetical protein [Nostoc sp. NIES-3756]|uniref:hypothetical protein n=1 Tax=Nostoc sp. NIES-3756 TaxID=1751286 RepID=UPI0011DF23A0|nr:hypothetical protein [Nostoc sp. NIES-3756]